MHSVYVNCPHFATKISMNVTEYNVGAPIITTRSA
jgi:hypothetical protein